MRITVEIEKGKKSIYIGGIPDTYDDDDWDESDRILTVIFDVIKNNFDARKGKSSNSFFISSNEFTWFRDDLMPIGIYATSPKGNEFIDNLTELLKEKFGNKFFKDKWNNVSAELKFNKKESIKALEYLITQYSLPYRYYHNIAHINQVLQKIEELQQHVNDVNIAILAAFFHDVVYEIRKGKDSSNNEEKRANEASRFLKKLGLHKESIIKVCDMVKATKHHKSTGNSDIDLFLDIDMSILASSADDYELYTKSVMNEYTSVSYSKIEYNKGRKELFLQPLLESEKIFLTEYFEPMETAARKNIKNEIRPGVYVGGVFNRKS